MDKVKVLEEVNLKLNVEIEALNDRLSNAESVLDSLNTELLNAKETISTAAQELESRISITEIATNQKVSKIDSTLGKTTLWVIIGILSAMLISAVLYWLLSKKQKSDKSDLIGQLTQTKSSIEESLIKEFDKQTELMDTQLELIKHQNNTASATVNAEPDHSFALKVAGEINLIERNIRLMDGGTKGLKQLNRSVEKLKDNLAASGYEVPELLGKQFHQGMKILVSASIPDENLEIGSEVISKVLIPQVNYKGKMIQTAEIETSVGC